jgi:tRNA (mo5U34)-methyltransferase
MEGNLGERWMIGHVRKATDMGLAEMQRRIDAVPWYHEFDFPNGLKARSSSHIEWHRLVWRFIESQLAAVDFCGKTVLDIGCWDGYWSFYAERRGAKSVLATDDVSQNWSGGEGLRLAKQLLGSQVEIDQRVSIYELGKLGRTFDIILCLGVYYHLLDPYYALAQVRHCCHPGTIVLVEGDGAAGGLRPNALMFDLSDPGVSIFVPTAQAWEHMLRGAYLDVKSQTWLRSVIPPLPPPAPPPAGRLGWRWRLKTAASALAGSRSAVQEQARIISPPAAAAVNVDRLFTTCVAFEGVNPMHAYAPPFGLDRYDERFRTRAAA